MKRLAAARPPRSPLRALHPTLGGRAHQGATPTAARAAPCLRAASSAAGTSTPPHELVAWVESRGGAVNGVAPADLAGRDGGSGWGLKASADHAPGARLVDLPSSCHLTYDGSADTKLLALIEQVPKELWGAKLALQLLQHRLLGADSPFSPYVSNLPQGFPGVPIFFAREAIEAMEYPPTMEQVKKRCRWMYRFSQGPLASLPGSAADPFGGSDVDINALGWALAAVTSRAFRVRGPSHPAALLPLIDMANHSFAPNCEVQPLTGGGITLVAKRQIDAGEPLLLSYGPLPNEFLLLDYGFVVPSNPYDRVELRFTLDLLNVGALVANVRAPDGASLLELQPKPWQRAVLQQLGLLEGSEGAQLQVSVGGTPPIDSRLLAATRVLAATYQSEVDSSSPGELGDWQRPLNRANEVAALRILSGVCAAALSRFSTTLDEDEALLTGTPIISATGAPSSQSGRGGAHSDASASSSSAEEHTSAAAPVVPPLTEDVRLAVNYRASLKRLLSSAIQALAARVQELPGVPGLKASAVAAVPVRKGQKPRAATDKGFGAAGRGTG